MRRLLLVSPAMLRRARLRQARLRGHLRMRQGAVKRRARMRRVASYLLVARRLHRTVLHRQIPTKRRTHSPPSAMRYRKPQLQRRTLTAVTTPWPLSKTPSTWPPRGARPNLNPGRRRAVRAVQAAWTTRQAMGGPGGEGAGPAGGRARSSRGGMGGPPGNNAPGGFTPSRGRPPGGMGGPPGGGTGGPPATTLRVLHAVARRPPPGGMGGPPGGGMGGPPGATLRAASRRREAAAARRRGGPPAAAWAVLRATTLRAASPTRLVVRQRARMRRVASCLLADLPHLLRSSIRLSAPPAAAQTHSQSSPTPSSPRARRWASPPPWILLPSRPPSRWIPSRRTRRRRRWRACLRSPCWGWGSPSLTRWRGRLLRRSSGASRQWSGQPAAKR